LKRAIALLVAFAISLVGFVAFGTGIGAGMDYDIADAEMSVYGLAEIGDPLAQAFTLTVGTEDVLSVLDRYLTVDAKYFIGYPGIAGVAVFGGIDFAPYALWYTAGGSVFNDFGVGLRGDIFDVFPSFNTELSAFVELNTSIELVNPAGPGGWYNQFVWDAVVGLDLFIPFGGNDE